jgi:hypothetical protein
VWGQVSRLIKRILWKLWIVRFSSSPSSVIDTHTGYRYR